MKPLIFNLFNQAELTQLLTSQLNGEQGELTIRQFPDQETYLRFHDELTNRTVLFVASLNNPNPKLSPLLFAAETARSLGANQVGLVTPYLAYMRQDKQFKSGEGITSKYFARLLSQSFNWLVTVDPHLHRYHSLDEIYSIPSQIAPAAPQIASWLQNYIDNPILIGPDEESEQWLTKIAKLADLPYLILQKIRHGDRAVEVSKPELAKFQNHTPVLIDDIISTAHTMIETIKQLQQAQLKPPVCIGVHAVFAGDAFERLQKSTRAQVVTCNTIAHSTNQINLANSIADKVKLFL